MMNQLRKNQRDAIKSKYAQNLLFKGLYPVAKGLESRMKHLRLSAEEVFLNAMYIIDDVKDDLSDGNYRLRSVWDEVYCNIRELSSDDTEEDEILLATSEVVYYVMLILSYCDGAVYNKLALELVCKMDEHACKTDEMQHLFMPNIWRLGDDAFKKCVMEYMQSDVFLSDEMEEMLKGLPEPSFVVEREHNTKNGEQLTIRQIVILFQHLLNVALDSTYTNISAFSRLIEKVSGYSSVRTSILQGNFDYDTDAVKNDIEVVAKLLDNINRDNNKIADNLRNQIN